MSQFIETICLKNGGYQHLDLHQTRLNKVFSTFFPKKQPHLLNEFLPEFSFSQQHKVRVLYDQDSINVEFSTYEPAKIQSLKIIKDDSIDYQHKSADRTQLNSLYSQRAGMDDILIIKNGLVTDTYYCNPLFWNGDQWIAPSSHLLNGVKRQSLLKENLICEETIHEVDIKKFEKVCLINAMLDPGDIEIDIDQVRN